MKKFFILILTVVFVFLTACETTKPYYGKQERDWASRIPPAKDDVSYTVWLIGDAGESNLYPLDSALALARVQMRGASENSAVVFLGDNIYPAGLPPVGDSTRRKAEEHLKAELALLDDFKGKPFFIPGNHDWNRMKAGGREAVIRQADYIEDYLNDDNVFFPENGCGDPVAVELSDDVTLIMIDSQWWLQRWEDEKDINKGCEIKSRAELEAKLASLIDEYDDTNMILAMHHPVFTQGSHNGYFPITEHLFPLTYLNEGLYIPLPGIGSLHPVNRFLGTSRQDATNALYKRLIEVINNATFRKRNMIIASGHEHNLQYFNEDDKHFIVSGAGSKKSYLKRGLDAEFLHERQGFVKVDYFKDGQVWMEYWTAQNAKGQGNLVYRKQLKGKILQGDEKPEISFKEIWKGKPDSVTYIAAPHYEAGKGKRFWLGRNYRDVWTGAIPMPILDMDTMLGGLTIIKKGGGQQSVSFRLRAERDGKQYVLRSVYKDATPTMPNFLKNTFVDSIFQDQMSMDHPYGATVVSNLAKGAGVYHTNPTFYYVPKQPRLGDFITWGDQVYLFEERPDDDRSDVDGFGNSKKIVSYRKMLKKTTDDPDDVIDEESVLRARLFDMLIGDWDRHDDQWRWATFKDKENDKKIYRPIPRDRDHAFLSFRGVLPWIASRPFAARQLQSFNKNFGDIKGLNFNARHFDRSYLTQLTREDWKRIADDLKNSLSDAEIDNAVNAWPKELIELNGDELKVKLRSRRDQIIEAAMKHYKFLAEEVEVRGSNEPDVLEATYLPNGNLHVKVFDSNKERDKKVLFYDRIFLPKETRAVRMFGLDGNDIFIIKGDKQRKIKLTVIGGKGKDTFNSSELEGNGKKLVIVDNSTEKHTIVEGSVEDKCDCDNDEDNVYNRLEFKYNKTIPIVIVRINPDDGLFLGLGYDRIAHGWNHDPFKTKEKVFVSTAVATGAITANYDVLWNNTIGNWDLGIDAYYAAPTFVINYFGRGNNTPNPRTDRALFNFNRVRYSQFHVKPRVVQQFGGGDQFFTIEGGYTYTEAERNADRYTGEQNDQVSGLSDSDFEAKHYLSLSAKYNVERVDSKLNPKRGIKFHAEAGINQGVNTGGLRFGFAETELTFYYRPFSPFPLTLAFRGGLAANFGETEFFQSQFLGRRNGLRGFRGERFAGDRVAYLNSEARLTLGTISGIFPNMEVGLIGAYDQGRVWVDNENATNWHRSVGGGLWIAPYEVIYISGTLSQGIIRGGVESSFVDFRLGFWF